MRSPRSLKCRPTGPCVVALHNRALRIIGERRHDVQHEIVLRGVPEFGTRDHGESDLEPAEAHRATSRNHGRSSTADQTGEPGADRRHRAESACQTIQRRSIQRRSRIALVETLGQQRPPEFTLAVEVRPARLILTSHEESEIR